MKERLCRKLVEQSFADKIQGNADMHKFPRFLLLFSDAKVV